MARWRAGALALALSVLAPTPSLADPARFLDYIYVDANEGGSSGGHAALRLGDEVFHYEYRPPGILIPRRDTFDHFRYQYATLENRTIEISRIPVGEERYARILDQFSRDHLIRSQQLAVLDQAGADRRVLEELIAGAVVLDGLGFFAARERVEGDHETEPAIVALRRQVDEQYGPAFLDDQLEKSRRQLVGLMPGEVDREPPALTEDRAPAPTYTFPQRYRDTLTIVAALEVLRDAPRLAEHATITAHDPYVKLQEADQTAVELLSRELASSLVRLLRSGRPDWGFPLLLGMARLATLDRVRQEGRWIFLDAFPSDAIGIDPDRLAKRAAVLAALTDEARREFARARSGLWSAASDEASFPEAAYARLEEAGNRFIEARRALVERSSLRVSMTRSLPTRSAAHLAPPPRADESGGMLRGSLAAAEARAQAVTDELQRLYGYNLITRNCVTELFRDLNRAGLGIATNSSGSLDFIPFVSTLTIETAYPASGTFRILSARRTGLERLYQGENPLRVFLRESNTITSTLYHRNPTDSIFLFFTDDVIVARPVFGAVNLLVGLGASVVGLARLPVDGGATALSGLKGAMFSLPELFFQNIRKGSYEFAPQP